MPIGPLKNLSVFRPSGSNQSGRAQSFSPTNLGRDSIKNAKTSMSRAMGSNNNVSTSVFHPGGDGNKATTSISRPTIENSSLGREQKSDEEREDLRYNYIRRLVKARQEKEKKEASKKKN